MNIFRDVKAAVTTREAAERYGVAVRRGGMACCIFHADRTPSMKVDTRYHCFACGADGDVIAFTAQLFGLTPMLAAEKLARDFGVPVVRGGARKAPGAAQARRPSEPPQPPQPYDKTAYVVRLYGQYRELLEQLRRDHAPKSPHEALDARFCEAVHGLGYAAETENWLRAQTPQTRADWLILHREEVRRVEQRVRDHHKGGSRPRA